MPGRVCVRRRHIVPIVIQPVAHVALVVAVVAVAAVADVAAAQRVHGMCWKTQKERRKKSRGVLVQCTVEHLYVCTRDVQLEMATIQLSLSVEVRNRLACTLSIVPRSDFHCTQKRCRRLL